MLSLAIKFTEGEKKKRANLNNYDKLTEKYICCFSEAETLGIIFYSDTE